MPCVYNEYTQGKSAGGHRLAAVASTLHVGLRGEAVKVKGIVVEGSDSQRQTAFLAVSETLNPCMRLDLHLSLASFI